MLGEIQIDQRGFFRQGRPYSPVISPCPCKGEVCAIPLDLKLDSELKWEEVEKGDGEIFWQLDFGLDRPSFPWNSAVALSALQRAVTRFIDDYLTKHKEKTLGICLYHGPLTTDSAQILATYLQQLAALFPDELPLFACFDTEQMTSPTQIAQLISPDYFPYLHIGLAASRYPMGILRQHGENWAGLSFHDTTLGVVLPLAKELSSVSACTMDRWIDQLQDEAIPYRILYESHMSEQWDGLDSLVLFSTTLSEQGRRKVRGFIAAGGTVVIIGDQLGFSKEMTIETYLA